MPGWKYSKNQLPALEVEKTRTIANVPIHAERVIRRYHLDLGDNLFKHLGFIYLDASDLPNQIVLEGFNRFTVEESSETRPFMHLSKHVFQSQ